MRTLIIAAAVMAALTTTATADTSKVFGNTNARKLTASENTRVKAKGFIMPTMQFGQLLPRISSPLAPAQFGAGPAAPMPMMAPLPRLQ